MQWLYDHESRRAAGQAEELLSAVEGSVREACLAGDVALASGIAQGLVRNRLIAEVKIKAGDRILAEMRQSAGKDGTTGIIYRTVSLPVEGEAGTIELAVDKAFIEAQAVDYWAMSSVLLMLETVAVAWAAAWMMMRRVVKPIRFLARRTRAIRIGTGDQVSLPANSNENEIGQLAHRFNRTIYDANVLLAVERMMREKIILNERCMSRSPENAPDIIVRYDRNIRRVFANPANGQEAVNPANRLLNSPDDNADLRLPDTVREEYRRRLQHVMDSGVPDRLLLEWTRPDGHWNCHELYVAAEYDANAEVTGALAICRDVTEHMAAQRQLLHQASYDALTGLPNRQLFKDRLHQEIVKAERHGHDLAVLFVDLDRFKEINDTLGHSIGDQLLIETAQRICSCVRESDTVARLAGDEFVVIVTDIPDAGALERIAQCMVTGIGRPFQSSQYNAFVSASIGIAVYPQDAVDAEALISCADQAMFVAKEAGRNNYHFFTGAMLERTQRRLQLAGDLREALVLGQLEVHYQPIVAVEGGRTVKAEALLRWRHPRLGMVPPDQFVAIAEETGLIEEIGAWVFREAVDVAKRWNDKAGSGNNRQISVNISPRQFGKGNLVSMALDYLRVYGLDPACIALEITESLLLDDSWGVAGQMERLRDGGIEISLDDFGTGYSAMAYLKKFNIDYLKIDRSFIRDLETDSGDRAIAEAIIVMSHRLGLKVIAEGVETEAQQALLAGVGCEYVQGYLHAKPMPAEVFLRYVGDEARFAVAGHRTRCSAGQEV